MRSERGQATVEWVGLVAIVALSLGALARASPHVDGRSVGSLVAHSLVCAVRGHCDDGDRELRAAYGTRDAELVRRYAPGIVYEPGTLTLPVDYRECRSHRCSDAPDDPDLDVSRSLRGGARATAFTHVVHDRGETFIQYWLYYPDSTTTWGGAAGAWNTARGLSPLGGPPYPGWHDDDWEGFQLRIDRSGGVWARATSHHGYQGCKQRRCANRWMVPTGWTRVSRGSHAGHLPLRSRPAGVWLAPRPPFVRTSWRYEALYPGVDLRERTTGAAALRLIPLETLDGRGSARFADGIRPPWRKEVYSRPRSQTTS
jgi:hypothetical protein